MTLNASSYTGKETVFISLQYACRASAEQRRISRFAGGADSLLDLACGRGGDIWKWTDARVRSVVAHTLYAEDGKVLSQLKLPADQVH